MIKIIFIIVALVYGYLNILASIIGFIKTKTTLLLNFMMLIGGVLISFSIIPFLKNYSFILLVLGLILIHITTIKNGFILYGKLHLSHHLVRFLISFFIIFLYFIR